VPPLSGQQSRTSNPGGFINKVSWGLKNPSSKKSVGSRIPIRLDAFLFKKIVTLFF
jgi:hypothetical protein